MDGLTETVGPDGETVADNATVAEKPFVGATVIVAVFELPAVTVRLDVLLVKVKSCVAGAATVKCTV